MSDIPNKFDNLTETALPSSGDIDAPTPSNGSSFWRYFVVFLILCFLGLNLVLFLVKPADKDITHLYDPIKNLLDKHFGTNFGNVKKGPIVASVSKKNNAAAVKKLEKTLDAKPVINNIDNENISNQHISNQQTNLQPEPIKKYKKLPVIPEADDSTSRVQMKSSSKSGFCYIGEDRGFRSCIEVGEGDVCMSGNIFPTEAICINPNLRE
jgi:hypothetical protein